MSVTTATQFVYSIIDEYGDYANSISNALLLTEVKEQELRKFKIATICVEAIRNYFARYIDDVAPTDDENGLTKEEIENIVQIFNQILNTNYWYEFSEDE